VRAPYDFCRLVYDQYWEDRKNLLVIDPEYHGPRNASLEAWYKEKTGYQIYDFMVDMNFGISFCTNMPDACIMQVILSGVVE
jgi:hypothetical protein